MVKVDWNVHYMIVVPEKKRKRNMLHMWLKK